MSRSPNNNSNQLTGNGSDFVLMDHGNILRSFALRLTGNMEEAQDLVQDTLLKALVNQDKFQVDSNLRAWLMTIMKNTFINTRKRSSRKVKLDTSDEYQMYGNPDFMVDNLGPTTLGMREKVKLIRKVDRSCRKVFLLHLAGYKYQEIAGELNIPLGTVKVRIHRARKRLRILCGPGSK